MWANHSFCPIHHHRAVQAVGNAPEATVLVVGDETWWNHDWDHAMGPCNGGVFDNVWNGGWLISLFQLMVQYSCWGINSNFFADSYTVVSWPTHLATISCVSLHVVVNLCKPTLWLFKLRKITIRNVEILDMPTHKGEYSYHSKLPLPMWRVHLKGCAHHLEHEERR